ncbi:hypothetical protein HPB51_006088 [Rhipicephalus microplus]|uniref:CBM20 domain-containing protein n=1 Tax=Rhipicephalus microplus TaxID=6941 RepID=A0A9J6EF36_RHIMP|nr:hypothetical protein HPB51_006088 [Rhipicephalus microplus]
MVVLCVFPKQSSLGASADIPQGADAGSGEVVGARLRSANSGGGVFGWWPITALRCQGEPFTSCAIVHRDVQRRRPRFSPTCSAGYVSGGRRANCPFPSEAALELANDSCRQLHLRVQAVTLHGETVFVCGSTPQLGEWQVARALEMHLEDPATKVWGVKVSAPLHKTLEFRYFIGILLENSNVIVRRWETVRQPRTVSANELTMDRNAAVDMFGNYDGEDKVEPGWLTTESIVHLKMFDNPIVLWKRKYKSVPISYHITPIDLSVRNSDVRPICDESDQHSNTSDFECVKWPVIEIAE